MQDSIIIIGEVKNPDQKKIRDAKKVWNKQTSEFISSLIEFKKLINGKESKFYKEKSKITEPIPVEPSSVMQSLYTDFEVIKENASRIGDAQKNYSTNHKAGRYKKQASNKLTRFLSYLKRPYFGNSETVYSNRNRKSLLSMAANIASDLKELNSSILKRSKQSIADSNAILNKLEKNIFSFITLTEAMGFVENKALPAPSVQTETKTEAETVKDDKGAVDLSLQEEDEMRLPKELEADPKSYFAKNFSLNSENYQSLIGIHELFDRFKLKDLQHLNVPSINVKAKIAKIFEHYEAYNKEPSLKEVKMIFELYYDLKKLLQDFLVSATSRPINDYRVNRTLKAFFNDLNNLSIERKRGRKNTGLSGGAAAPTSGAKPPTEPSEDGNKKAPDVINPIAPKTDNTDATKQLNTDVFSEEFLNFLNIEKKDINIKNIKSYNKKLEIFNKIKNIIFNQDFLNTLKEGLVKKIKNLDFSDKELDSLIDIYVNYNKSINEEKNLLENNPDFSNFLITKNIPNLNLKEKEKVFNAIKSFLFDEDFLKRINKKTLNKIEKLSIEDAEIEKLNKSYKVFETIKEFIGDGDFIESLSGELKEKIKNINLSDNEINDLKKLKKSFDEEKNTSALKEQIVKNIKNLKTFIKHLLELPSSKPLEVEEEKKDLLILINNQNISVKNIVNVIEKLKKFLKNSLFDKVLTNKKDIDNQKIKTEVIEKLNEFNLKNDQISKTDLIYLNEYLLDLFNYFNNLQINIKTQDASNGINLTDHLNFIDIAELPGYLNINDKKYIFNDEFNQTLYNFIIGIFEDLQTKIKNPKVKNRCAPILTSSDIDFNFLDQFLNRLIEENNLIKLTRQSGYFKDKKEICVNTNVASFLKTNSEFVGSKTIKALNQALDRFKEIVKKQNQNLDVSKLKLFSQLMNYYSPPDIGNLNAKASIEIYSQNKAFDWAKKKLHELTFWNKYSALRVKASENIEKAKNETNKLMDSLEAEIDVNLILKYKENIIGLFSLIKKLLKALSSNLESANIDLERLLKSRYDSVELSEDQLEALERSLKRKQTNELASGINNK